MSQLSSVKKMYLACIFAISTAKVGFAVAPKDENLRFILAMLPDAHLIASANHISYSGKELLDLTLKIKACAKETNDQIKSQKSSGNCVVLGESSPTNLNYQVKARRYNYLRSAYKGFEWNNDDVAIQVLGKKIPFHDAQVIPEFVSQKVDSSILEGYMAKEILKTSLEGIEFRVEAEVSVISPDDYEYFDRVHDAQGYSAYLAHPKVVRTIKLEKAFNPFDLKRVIINEIGSVTGELSNLSSEKISLNFGIQVTSLSLGQTVYAGERVLETSTFPKELSNLSMTQKLFKKSRSEDLTIRDSLVLMQIYTENPELKAFEKFKSFPSKMVIEEFQGVLNEFGSNQESVLPMFASAVSAAATQLREDIRNAARNNPDMKLSFLSPKERENARRSNGGGGYYAGGGGSAGEVSTLEGIGAVVALGWQVAEITLGALSEGLH